MKKKETAIRAFNNIKKMIALGLALGTMAGLSGCSSSGITWEQLNSYLDNPVDVINEVANRNKAIIVDYRENGLMSTIEAENSKKAIDIKVNKIIESPESFVSSVQRSLVSVADYDTSSGTGALIQKALGTISADDKLKAEADPIPAEFMDDGFYQSVLTNMNKRIFVLNPDLKPEEFANCVTACQNAVLRPYDAKAIQALTDASHKYFVDSGKTLHQYNQDELFANSSPDPETALKIMQPNNKLNSDLGISGIVEYAVEDENGNVVEIKQRTEVVMTIRVREFSKAFADQVSRDKTTKNKYLTPQVQVGGDSELDTASMNRIFLMEYPVKVLNTIQLGTVDTKESVGADTYAPIFEKSDLKVNLGSGEMLWKDKVVNKEEKESERIYHVTGENPSFTFINDGGNAAMVEDISKDIQLRERVNMTFDESLFPSSELSTDTAYSEAYLMQKFGMLYAKTIDGLDGKYLGLEYNGKKVFLNYVDVKVDGPSLIQQKWKSPGGKADEVVSLRDNVLRGPLPDSLLTESVIGTYGPGAYVAFGPEEGKTTIDSKSEAIGKLVDDSDYTGITYEEDEDGSRYIGYFNYKTIRPPTSARSTSHINWPYVEFAGLKKIPSREEVGLSDSQFRVFLSSPEVLNIARKYNEDNVPNSKIEVDPGIFEEKDWCQTDKLMYFFPEYTISGEEYDDPNEGEYIKKEDIDPQMLRRENGKYIYTYEGVDYYCTSPYDASQEVNSATIILRDYLELTYMPGVYPNTESEETEPFIATGRRVKLTKSKGGKTTKGLDTDIAIFADKFGKPIEDANGNTVIRIGDLVDFSSGNGYYEHVGEKLGLGVKNLDRVQEALNSGNRDGKLKDIILNRGEDDEEEDNGLSDTGLITDQKLLEHEVYFDWIRPCLMFAYEGNGDDRPGLAASDQSNMSSVFWGLCVDTDAFKTHLYTGWIDIDGDGGDIGSLAWWNGWLRQHNYNYHIDPSALKGAMEKVYADSISEKDNTIIFNMNTISKINEILDKRDTEQHARSRSTVFTVLGIVLLGYGFLLGLFWVIDTNLINGPGLLTWATFGKFQAIVDKDEMPFYSDNGRTFVTLGQLLFLVLGLWVFACVLILVDVTAIWGWALQFLKNIVSELKKLMFNMM